MTQELLQLLDENFEYNLSKIHIAFPGIVKSYDKDARRCEVQPSIQMKMADGTFNNFPVLVDVPVLYFGTSKGGIHIPLEENDEVLIICSEKCLDSWKNNGGAEIQEKDVRKFSLSDAIAIPGLQATTFPSIDNKDNFSLHHDDEIDITVGQNKFIMSGNDGFTIQDKNNNKIEMGNNGITITGKTGGKIEVL